MAVVRLAKSHKKVISFEIIFQLMNYLKSWGYYLLKKIKGVKSLKKSLILKKELFL